MIFNESGGTSLNFKVVRGTSAPASPKENTIWVNMSSAITDWYFGSDEPDVRKEGTLWITTGVSGNVAFNALKKNGLKVYPISAKHYRSGAWVEKPAKIYQGGKWVDWWDGSLYKIGNQYTEITGGWVPRGVSSLGTSYTPTAPNIVFNESGMRISVNSTFASGVSECKKDIDLSTRSVLTVDVSNITFVSGVSDIAIWVAKRNALSEVKGVASAVVATTGTIRTKGVYTIDVSALNGMYDIAIWVSTTNGEYTDITIKSVALS